MCVPSSQICGETICPLYSFCDSSSRRCIPETCAHRQAVWCPQHPGELTAQDCGPYAECLGTHKLGAGGFVCQYTESGLLVSHCGHAISVGLAAALQDPEQAHLASCCALEEASSSSNDISGTGDEFSDESSALQSIAEGLAAGSGLTSHGVGSSSAGSNSVGSMNRAIVEAEAELPGLEALNEELYEQGMGPEPHPDVDNSFETAPQRQLGATSPPVDTLKQRPDQKGQQQKRQQQQQQQETKQQRNTGTARWSLGKLGSSLFRRAGRALLQIFPEGISKLGMEELYPNMQSSSDPNMPFGTGNTARFMEGMLDNAMNAPSMMNLMGRLVGPSMGGPVATGRFTPVVNSQGNIINTGAGPGGLMIRAGPGGLTAGVYGGGWAGPYNRQTGQYGMGGNYGFARPYHGRAQGSAVVFMPAFAAPNAPNVTYPCPVGRGNGSIISPGVPCGIPITAVPASQLPTINGMPAAVDISSLAVSLAVMQT